MFVLGTVLFQLEKFSLSFDDQLISVYGVTGLPWPPLSPSQHYGKSVFVQVKITEPAPLMFLVAAQLNREFTVQSQVLNLRFHFEDEMEKVFTEFTKKYGKAPEQYARKFPRIPAMNLIQTCPIDALMDLEGSKGQTERVTFGVENISPGGVSIMSEHPLALSLQIQQEISCVLDPRGLFPTQVRLRGVIRRITDDYNLAFDTTTRRLGVQFAGMKPEEQKIYATFLKEILLQIKDLYNQEKPSD